MDTENYESFNEKYESFNLNISNIQWMIDEIETMTMNEHIHMSTLVEKMKVDDKKLFTENDNGLFVKFNELSLQTIKALYDYVVQVKKSRNTFESSIQMVRPLELDNVDKSTETKNDLKTNLLIDDWKMRVIEKIRNENKMKQRRKRTNTKVEINE